jgi:hypothetical protein
MATENRKKMSDIEWVIKTLMKGEAVRSSDIAEEISGAFGNEISSRRISGILSRISNPEKCDLGFFIEKVRSGNSFVYRMVKEALCVPEDKIADLAGSAAPQCGTAHRSALGCGAPGDPGVPGNRYTLEQALKDFPALCRYSGPKAAVEYRACPDADKKIGISLRYSDKYSISASASPSVFLTVCIAVALILTVCCFIAYLFFFPLFITVIAAGIILATAAWKISRGG